MKIIFKNIPITNSVRFTFLEFWKKTRKFFIPFLFLSPLRSTFTEINKVAAQ